MIPSCQPMTRKLDKLTVLRKAVQHLKALKGNCNHSTAELGCLWCGLCSVWKLGLCFQQGRAAPSQTQPTSLPSCRTMTSGTSCSGYLLTYTKSGLTDTFVCLLTCLFVCQAADGFLLVVSCDRAKILFISESVSKILNFSRVLMIHLNISMMLKWRSK